MLDLYHHWRATCGRVARLAFAEKGVEWNDVLVTDRFSPEYTKLNPNNYVPTLVHDGRVIIESSVIVSYVDDLFDGPDLKPSDPYDRARMYFRIKMRDERYHYAINAISFGLASKRRFAGRVGSAVPVVLTGGDEDHVSLSDGQRLVVAGDGAGAFGDNQDLVAGMLVKLIPRTGVEGDDGEVEIVAVAGVQNGLAPDLGAGHQTAGHLGLGPGHAAHSNFLQDFLLLLLAHLMWAILPDIIILATPG